MNSGDEILCVYAPVVANLGMAFKYMIPMINDNQWIKEGESVIISDVIDEEHIFILDKGYTPDGQRFAFKKNNFVKPNLETVLEIIKKH